MSIFSKFKNWVQARRDRKAQSLPDGHNDIVLLYKKGILAACGTGQTITDIRAEITSRVNVPVKVSIPHGTYFISRGNHQNMVTRRKYEFVLSPMEKRNITVPASCINASLPIPGDEDRFSGVAQVSDTLRRFMEAAEPEDAMVIQAGVWAITDGYSREQMKSTLRVRRSDSRSGGMFGGLGSNSHDAGSAISDYHMDRAKKILTELKISNTL